MGNIRLEPGVSLSAATKVNIEEFLKANGPECQTGSYIKAAFPTAQKIAKVIKWSGVWEAFRAWFYSCFRKGEYIGLVDKTVRHYKESLPSAKPVSVVVIPEPKIPVNKLMAFNAARERVAPGKSSATTEPTEDGQSLKAVFAMETVDPDFVRRVESAWQRLTHK